MAEIKNKISVFGLSLILAIVAGALSGVIAAIATNQSIEKYAASLSERMDLIMISQVKPGPLPGTFEESLRRVQENGWRSLVVISAVSTDRTLS